MPDAVVDFVADQVGVADRSLLAGYLERDKTRYEHQWEITEAFSYRPWSDPGAQLQVRVFIASRAWTSPEGPTALFERTVVWLREHKVLLPGVSVPARLVSEVRTEQAERLYREVIVIAAGADLFDATPAGAAVLDAVTDLPGLLERARSARRWSTPACCRRRGNNSRPMGTRSIAARTPLLSVKRCIGRCDAGTYR